MCIHIYIYIYTCREIERGPRVGAICSQASYHHGWSFMGEPSTEYSKSPKVVYGCFHQ